MPIPYASFVILFVKTPLESGTFYQRLLGLDPIEQSPTFVLFALPNGLMLGLWSRATAKPTVRAEAGSSEICFSETSAENVDKLFAKWSALGISMAQSPVAMDGMSRTFVALDPDGHRIRILALEEDHHA